MAQLDNTNIDGSLTINGVNIFLLMYPVGAIYMSANSTNPGNLFGGTWEAWGAGRVPVGVGSNGTTTYSNNSTGGAESRSISGHTHSIASHTHTTGNFTLTTSHIPAHTHGSKTLTGKFWNWCGQDGTYTGTANGIFSMGTTDGGAPYPSSKSTASGKVDTLIVTATHEHTSVGGGSAHNHGATGGTALTTASGGSATVDTRQPYVTCYMWKRTA